jgi:predicted secreted protein
MANPNILNTTIITGGSNSHFLTTNTNTILLTGIAGSVYKINSIVMANLDGGTNYNFTLNHGNANGANIPLAYQVTVPADASVVVVDKSSTIYIEENQKITGGANANSKISAIISYEVLT